MISYNIDDNGTLKIWINNHIHAEISDCVNLTENEIEKLIQEITESEV